MIMTILALKKPCLLKRIVFDKVILKTKEGVFLKNVQIGIVPVGPVWPANPGCIDDNNCNSMPQSLSLAIMAPIRPSATTSLPNQ
jgi:hypothetical protein